MGLREFFERAAIIARREGLPFTARDKSLVFPVDKVRHYLMLDGNNLKRKVELTYRIEFGLRVNLNNRPSTTLGFESKPESNLVMRGKPQFGTPDDVDEQYVSASQAVIVTDYKKAIGRHGFAVMIHDRITNVNTLPKIFGIHGSYGKDGQLTVRRLAVPAFDDGGNVSALREIAVTKDNITLALTYAKLCAEQVFFKEPLTPSGNWKKAVNICKGPEPVEQFPAPR